MNMNIIQAFKNLDQIEPSGELKRRILRQIDLEKSRAAKEKIFWLKLSLILSAVAAVFALIVFGRSFFDSDFWRLISLMFSDASVLGFVWQEYLISLAETLPVVALIGILVPFAAISYLFGKYLDVMSGKQKFI
jgi:ABC-type multidrug transport system permease subunit